MNKSNLLNLSISGAIGWLIAIGLILALGGEIHWWGAHILVLFTFSGIPLILHFAKAWRA